MMFLTLLILAALLDWLSHSIDFVPFLIFLHLISFRIEKRFSICVSP